VIAAGDVGGRHQGKESSVVQKVCRAESFTEVGIQIDGVQR